MESPNRALEAADGRRQHFAAARFGYVAALGTGVMTLLSFCIAVFTPPRSGSLFNREVYTAEAR